MTMRLRAKTECIYSLNEILYLYGVGTLVCGPGDINLYTFLIVDISKDRNSIITSNYGETTAYRTSRYPSWINIRCYRIVEEVADTLYV